MFRTRVQLACGASSPNAVDRRATHSRTGEASGPPRVSVGRDVMIDVSLVTTVESFASRS